jgi:hypothetical protein
MASHWLLYVQNRRLNSGVVYVGFLVERMALGISVFPYQLLFHHCSISICYLQLVKQAISRRIPRDSVSPNSHNNKNKELNKF